MPLLKLQSPLTPEERGAKRKLVIRDTIALVGLLVITVLLFVATYFLFNSFSNQRSRLAKRWLARGEAALHSGHPAQAVEALRSALAYSPGQRSIEIDLAEALAASEKTQEATSYFNTLWEAEPGNGTINLQLARLSAKQGNQTAALQYYRASIYGTWEGDGSVKRREVRLELIKYLLDIKKFEQGRGELLIAAGNAPDEPAVKLPIAGLMEAAGDSANAAQIYKGVLQHRPPNLFALEGGGRAAFHLGNFVQSRDFLERAINHPGFDQQPRSARDNVRNLLAAAVRLLVLYPSPALSRRARGERILYARRLVQARLHACNAPFPGEPGGQAVSPAMADVLGHWAGEPLKLTVAQLERNPDLAASEMQMIYELELAADKDCGPPTGDDSLLSRIAQNPGAVESE